MMGIRMIFWKEEKVALRDTGEELKTNFGKGGMKKLVEDYLAVHSVVAVEAACYELSVHDGEDFTPEGYVKPSHLWKSAMTLAIHAYITKSQHKAQVEEKRCREDEGEGTSAKKQIRGEKTREQTPPPKIPMVDVSLSFDKVKKPMKEKGKGPAYKLQSDIEAATDLKAVLEEWLTEETAEALAHALGVDLTEDTANALADVLGAKRDKKEDVNCCQQAPEKKKVVRVRFEDKSEEENVVNPSHYTREHWARVTREAMVKLEGLDEPIVALIDHGSEIIS
ncbi:hypothetical protein R1sor_012278 [Riccia sorocarpa]|uniref:Uncharacterized protein n=1 Tax=Riccia sorocarpa TaxID=122646 RepID=A0ABD3I7B5_9MARC